MPSSSLHRCPVPWLGLFAAFFAASALAQPTPSSLTLTEALARAAERNPTLSAQSYAGRAAEALVEQAGLRPNPTVEVGLENILGTGRVQGVRSSETTVQASQTFERGGKRDKRVTLATREREIALQGFAVRRSEVLATTATAFVATIAAQQRLALAAEPLRLARETLTAIEARVTAGAASPVETARARAALATAQADVARADAAAVAARSALAATWGGIAADIPSVTSSFHVPEILPSPENFLARLPTHPRIVLQTAVIANRRAALSLEQAQSTQDITASGGVRFLREGTDAAFIAGISVPIAVHNKNQGNIRAARETLAGAERTSSAIETELRASFSAAWQELAAAHTTAQSLRRDVLPPTEDAYAGVRRAYDSGQLPLLEVLEAQRALIAIRREILAAEADYAAALVRVESLVDPTFSSLSQLLRQP